MKVRRYVMASAAVMAPFVLSAVLWVGCNACSSGETDAPPIPSASAPTPSASATVAPDEDAGTSDASDAAADAPADAKVVTGDPTGLKACCIALRNNVTSVPADQAPVYLGAADVCDAAVKTQQTRQGLIQIRTFLKNAKVPAACQ